MVLAGGPFERAASNPRSAQEQRGPVFTFALDTLDQSADRRVVQFQMTCDFDLTVTRAIFSDPSFFY